MFEWTFLSGCLLYFVVCLDGLKKGNTFSLDLGLRLNEKGRRKELVGYAATCPTFCHHHLLSLQTHSQYKFRVRKWKWTKTGFTFSFFHFCVYFFYFILLSLLILFLFCLVIHGFLSRREIPSYFNFTSSLRPTSQVKIRQQVAVSRRPASTPGSQQLQLLGRNTSQRRWRWIRNHERMAHF